VAIDRITLDDWIARHDADLGQLWSGTAADQSWIEDQLTALANDPWIQACARARRDIEEFRLGFDDDLTGRLMDGLEADERDDFLRTYFSRDPQFRDSLTDFAARTIYDACRNSTPAAAESAETAAGSNAVAQDRAKDLPTAVEVGTEAADSTELPPAGDGPDAASPDDLLGTELNDNSMVEEVDQAREADQVEKADPSADNQSSAGEDPVDGTVPDPVPDPTEGTGPYEASEAAGLERGTAEEDREPANRRAEVLATIHRLAEQNRTGMVLHVDGKAPQSVDRVRTTELFSLMIDRVQEKGCATNAGGCFEVVG
jgi:hypothetical protein